MWFVSRFQSRIESINLQRTQYTAEATTRFLGSNYTLKYIAGRGEDPKKYRITSENNSNIDT